ncbi:hypothetical protein ARMGADRAFT_1035122 [Armillaria gallica]|uniref:Uncharacterized protein n=1 Tax=Armillaria gallica TaxID=47427 RepID=A0A2H3CYI4_ARMGA|nr:hypothetical protein ARMGADRAFT_1035122 [Armillaria gallica]
MTIPSARMTHGLRDTRTGNQDTGTQQARKHRNVNRTRERDREEGGIGLAKQRGRKRRRRTMSLIQTSNRNDLVLPEKIPVVEVFIQMPRFSSTNAAYWVHTTISGCHASFATYHVQDERDDYRQKVGATGLSIPFRLAKMLHQVARERLWCELEDLKFGVVVYQREAEAISSRVMGVFHAIEMEDCVERHFAVIIGFGFAIIRRLGCGDKEWKDVVEGRHDTWTGIEEKCGFWIRQS